MGQALGRTLLLAGLAALLAGCLGPGPRPDYDPHVTAADFVQGVDNPFLPWPPGASWVYESDSERIEVRVLPEGKDIQGVHATAVRDTVFSGGEMAEDTVDYYGQDRSGSVWYLGEDTKEYEHGKVVSTEGAWEWGVRGALPGVVMWAHPAANGTPYFQEFSWPDALDEAAVKDVGQAVTVPAGSFSDTVVTKEWTRLEHGEETAYYARGIGLVVKGPTGGSAGEQEKLVSYSVPGA